ncbi:DUF192 domain-containing protein [Pectinatus frisingensis]|uniref:DUF192 domain-containing protein n=1 Tax=Pectinatus frisingensis TaxID=865 RepID=UPI001E46CEDF|nr:DUF192 domain-containing protein [Pectinatus frisingensis]
MKYFIVQNKKYPPLRIEAADTFLKRLIGLMGRKKLPPDQGMLLSPCNSIHMLFMRFAIDAVYLDRDNRIIRIVRHLQPWLGISLCFRAHAVLEVTAGTAQLSGYHVGLQLLKKESFD